MGPRTGLDRCGKYRSPPGFDPRTMVSIDTEKSRIGNMLVVICMVMQDTCSVTGDVEHNARYVRH